VIALDGGAIFLVHERPNGRVFKCLNFRKTVMYSTKVLEQVLALWPPAEAQE
jgi:hypothetical protein